MKNPSRGEDGAAWEEVVVRAAVVEGSLGIDVSYNYDFESLCIEGVQDETKLLRAGDILLCVDGFSVRDKDLNECASRLRLALPRSGIAQVQVARQVDKGTPESSEYDEHEELDALQSQGQDQADALRLCQIIKKNIAACDVSLTDLSLWYASRGLIGGSRHLKREVKKLAQSKYEAAIWEPRPSEVDNELKPERCVLGIAPTAIKARALAETACRRRDATVWRKNMSVKVIELSIISSHFVGKRLGQRVALVVEALLSDEEIAFGLMENERHLSERVPKSTLLSFRNAEKGFCVSHLPVCARLGLRPQIALRLRTPAEANLAEPQEVEGYDAARLRPRALVKKPHSVERAPTSSKALHAMMRASTDDEDDVNMKNNPFFGHFFRSERREAQIKAQKSAKAALSKSRTDGEKPFFQAAMTKAHHILGSRVGPEVDKKIVYRTLAAQHQLLSRDDSEAALRLQRIFRLRLLYRGFRVRNRRHLAALQLQRRFRANVARQYTSLIHNLYSIAVTRIVTRVRLRLAIQFVSRRRIAYNAAALDIQRILFRGEATRRRIRWLREYRMRAVTIQRICRGYIGRTHWKLRAVVRAFYPTPRPQRPMRKENNWMLVPRIRKYWPAYSLPRRARCAVFHLGQSRIAAFFRVPPAKKVLASLKAAHYQATVVEPARRDIQRILRGFLARKEAKRRQTRHRAAIRIQSLLRRIAAILSRRKFWYIRRRRLALLHIQRRWRGKLDRLVYKAAKRRASRVRLRNILIPLVQKRIRGMLARRYRQDYQAFIEAALRLQRSYRCYLECTKAREARRAAEIVRRARHAASIQQRLRGILARSRYYAIKRGVTGIRIRAARIILRAWRRCQGWRKWEEHKHKWQLESAGRKLLALHDSAQEVSADMHDVRSDMQEVRNQRRWTRNRIKKIAEFQLQAQLRLPKIEEELDSIEAPDIDAGWAEALENEHSRLCGQLAMAREERHLLRVSVKRFDAQLRDLQLEFEDLEVDLDDLAVSEHELFEYLRRAELDRADKMAQRHRERQISLQRARWRINDVRTNLLARTRTEQHQLIADALEPLQLQMVSTLSFQNRRNFINQAKTQAKAADAQLRTERLQADIESNESHVTKLKDTYDSVISGCAALLQTAAIDLRQNKSTI